MTWCLVFFSAFFLLLHIYSNCRHLFFFKASINFLVALKLLMLRHNRKRSWETDTEASLSCCYNMESTESRSFQTENQSPELILGNKELKLFAPTSNQKIFFVRKKLQGSFHTVTCFVKRVNFLFCSPLLSKHYICFYTQNILPPTLNTLISFYYLAPHLFCKTKYEQQLSNKNF